LSCQAISEKVRENLTLSKKSEEGAMKFLHPRHLAHLHLAVVWRWESEHPSLWTTVLPCRSFQAKKQLISVGLAGRMVLLFGSDAKNFSNSV